MIKGASFVRALIERGHEVEVVTGFPNYPIGKLYPGYRLKLHQVETIEGVTVHRVPLWPSHGRSTIGRMLNYFSYVLSAALYGAFKAKPFDVIYSYAPPTVGLAATFIGFLRHRPFVLDVQDLWPDSVVKSGMPGASRMETALKAMCNVLYRRASRILVQSRGIAATLASRGVPPDKIDVVFNWSDENAARPLGTCDPSSYGMEGKFNVVYGGNLGAVQGLDTLIRAADIARATVQNLQLLLIGNGMDRDRLIAMRDNIGAPNVRIEPSVPRQQIGDIFAAADVLTLHLVDDPLFEITIPQKTQFYLAMGRPVLVGVRGEAADFVTTAGAGLAAEPENPQSVADAMIRLAQMTSAERAAMGRRGQKAYRRHFSFDTAVEQTLQTLRRASNARVIAH
jgi:glycosyltransferase involved in cell wall biosynthesis